MMMTKAILGLALASGLAVPALAQDRWDWRGWDRDLTDIGGPGVAMLYPELRETPRGRAFVERNFDLEHDGFISPREARAANRAFADIAGVDRAGFDWDRRGPAPDGPVLVAPVRSGGWDRAGMRAYHFRDTPEGARMTMQEDVLFRTDSAELRPGAIDKLHILAAYLRDNAGVRVAIDGYTDSRGSDAHNQDLSERRAASVRAALDEMGVTEARFRVRGFGERDPVATNGTPAGMRLNRRVEVTLLGQRASAFG